MYSSTLLCRQNPIQTNVICNYNLFLQTPLRVGLLSIAKIKATFIKCLFNGWYYSNGLLINWLINVKSTLISYSWLFNGSCCSTQYKIKPVHHVKKGSPYSITERRVPELIPVLGSHPAGDASHKPSGRLPLLSARPALTLATLKRAATDFTAWWTEAQWVWTVCLRLLPNSVATAIWNRALLRLSPAR